MKKLLQFFILSSLLTGTLYSDEFNRPPHNNRRVYSEIESSDEEDFDEDVMTRLTQAVDNDEIDEARDLLRNHHNDIDINHQDAGGNTLLHLAAFNDNPGMVRLLLRYHANPNIVDDQMQGALHAAAGNSNVAITQQLLNAGANPNAADVDGCTSLHMAIKSDGQNIAACVQTLLDGGANPNIAANDGYTPLHTAAMYDEVEVVRLLLQRGADRNMLTENGQLPIDLAREEGYDDVVDLLQ